jgi:MFS family permease
LIFLRRQPEDIGLFPDGVAPAQRGVASAGQRSTSDGTEISWQRGEALRTRALWLLVASAFLASVGTGGTAFHTAAYFTDVNIAPSVAAGAVSVMALCGALGNGLWGALAERVSARALNVSTMVLAAGAVALLTQVNTAPGAYVFAALFGANARGAAVLTQVLIARYYGRRAFGAISSVLDPFHKGGLGIGALVAALAFDRFGDYGAIFITFMIAYLLSALLIYLARKPEIGMEN